MSIAENIARVRERIEAAARKSGRASASVTLMAVSKTFPVDAIREACAAGIRVFGENRVQEFESKSGPLAGLEAEWHLIGHLQTNKANKAAQLFHAVDSVDSLKLAEKLDSAAKNLEKTLQVLIEINIGGEEAKSGLAPDSDEFEQLLQAAPRLSNLRIEGLMAIPPYAENLESTRPYFRRLREFRDQISARKLDSIEMSTLSMGMSHDFEVAIAEGSTCVRVGTAIFGERQRL